MKSLNTPSKQKNVQVRSKFQLNYKHFNNKSSICSKKCLTKRLKSGARNYQKPYPIFHGCEDGLEIDPLLKFVQIKQEYQLRMKTVKYRFHKYQEKLQICKQFQTYYTMQDLLSQEPDKYFSSNYNWYYTGGNLTMQKIGNTELMFHTTNNTELCFSKIRNQHLVWSLKKSVSSNHSSEIYQLDSANNNFKTFVGVRQKNDILLYDVKINDNEDVVCELANIQNTDIPFVSMCLNKMCHKEYVAVNAAQSLQIWDLFTLKPVYEYQVPHDLEALEGDCFAQVSYYENNTLAYINRTNSYIFDKRSNCISSRVKLDNIDILECHDRFVNVCPCQNNPSQYYISTYRDVLVFDVRRNNVVNKYSHAFTSAPYISDLKCDQNNTCIFAIASCKPNEKLIFEQMYSTYCIPVSLPTLVDSFESSLLHRSSKKISLSITNRLDASTTGMHLWSSDDKTFAMFSANVLGDIYCHEIIKSQAILNKEEHLEKWNYSLVHNRKEIKQLDYIDKLMLHGLKFSCNSKPAKFKSVIKTKRILDCIKDLKKSKRGFSRKICEVWENVSEANALDRIEQIPADVSVRNWLAHYCPEQEQPDS